jgi:hypothetical protein
MTSARKRATRREMKKVPHHPLASAHTHTPDHWKAHTAMRKEIQSMIITMRMRVKVIVVLEIVVDIK